jgi:anhydro-N-acetylmuramic acid kinase
MTTRWIIGLSSGSSVDGIDAALVEVAGAGLDMQPRLLHFVQQTFPRDLRQLLLQVSSTTTHTARQTSLAHRLLGETFAAAVHQLADQASVSLLKVQCVGCAGHIAWHDTDGRYPSTLGLGMPGIIAERTGLTTVSDFRTRDLAAGGQGYPLTPLVDYLLFHHPREHRVLIHLGGVASLVSLPAGGSLRQVVGFQAAPCNIMLDGFMRVLTNGRETYDAGGKHAVQGCCIESLLERWLNHPVLQKRPPKSLVRKEFGEEFVAQAVQLARQNQWSLHDVLCTATHLVARGILTAMHRFLPAPPTRVLLSGGGVRNGLLWRLFEQNLGHTPLERIDRHGIPVDARKAVAYAGLAAMTLDGVPANVTSVTGASGPRLLGSITPGSTANWAHCLAWMATQTAPHTLAAA